MMLGGNRLLDARKSQDVGPRIVSFDPVHFAVPMDALGPRLYAKRLPVETSAVDFKFYVREYHTSTYSVSLQLSQGAWPHLPKSSVIPPTSFRDQPLYRSAYHIAPEFGS